MGKRSGISKSTVEKMSKPHKKDNKKELLKTQKIICLFPGSMEQEINFD